MIYAFGPFELYDELLELRRDGARVATQPKALDLLFLLVRNRERVLRKQEILDALWPGVVVSEASLARTVMGVRRALDDDGDDPKLVLTVRGRGFRFAAPVDVRQRALQAAPAVIAGPTALVGRDASTAALLERLEEARAGRGGVTWVVGPRGIGRSAQLAELVSAARQRGVRAVLARCARVDGAPEGWPWVQLARALAEEGITLSIAAEAFTRDASGRFAHFDGALRSLARAAKTSPLLLAFDDLEQADAASVALLRFVAAHVGSLPLSIVLGLVDPPPRSEELAALLAEAPGARVVLRPLARADVATFAMRHARRTPPPELCEKLWEKSGGVPGLLVGLLGTAWATAALEGAEAGSSIDLDDGLVAKLARELADVGDRCRALLQLASVMGPAFELAPLARAAGVEVAEALDLLGDAARARLVLKPSGGVGAYRFAHPLLRDAIYKGLSESARAMRHATVAKALAGAADVETVADHMVRAAPVGYVEDAVVWALRAADTARARGDGAASRWVERARLAARLDPSAERDARIEEVAARVAASDA